MTLPANTWIDLPPRPEPPDPSECCGNGCDPCVHDLFNERLLEWLRLSDVRLRRSDLPDTAERGA
jgi:hypothetical protein